MLAWGNKVSKQFRDTLIAMCDRLVIDPNYMMACIAFETGCTFSPSILNKAGSGAVGLIQFMPKQALALGTDSSKLRAMSAEAQLYYVEKYFQNSRHRLNTLEDVYMAILWPSAIGKPNNTVLFNKADVNNPKLYIQNAGLDYNHDGLITKYEASQRVRDMLNIGLKPENAG